MTIGFHAPLPPARTGVADYAASLLNALRRSGDVRAGKDGDVNLYHLGNNQLHRRIYERALERPGVAVLHDTVLQHFFLGSLDEAAYVAEFVYNYGEWHRGMAAELWRGRGNSAQAARYFEYPMLKRIAERSRAVVVHNAAAARVVRAHAPQARVFEIPHLFEPPELPGAAEILRFRSRLGIAPGDFVFGIFGYLRESKRLLNILKAARDIPRTRLLVAGEFVSSDLERAAAPPMAAARAVRLPFQRNFWPAAAAADASLSLRWPSAGETSGITVRMMGIGKPVLVTAAEENDAYPDDACLRIDGGPPERESLREHMTMLARFPNLAREIGKRAAEYVARRHAIDGVAAEYRRVLCESRC